MNTTVLIKPIALRTFPIITLLILHPDYPRMTFENIEFISTSLISILNPKDRDEDRDPVPFLARFAVLQCSPTETPTSLLNICFLGFKIMLTVYPTSFGKYWKQIKKTILNYMEKNPGTLTSCNRLQ